MPQTIKHRTLAIIPARGGSKGVPRKNLRPLAGKPLIYYSIRAALEARAVDRVVVSTDDEEIALFARRFGAQVVMRPSDLASDQITLDPVIEHAVQAEERQESGFDTVVTIQPTSPLIRSLDIDDALEIFHESEADTIISVVADQHLRWTIRDGRYVPAYERRLNRQELPPTFKETGALLACRRSLLKKGTRIGEHIQLFELEAARSIDVDSTSDFFLCESLINRKRIVFAPIGHAAVGLGHVYRTLTLAHELVAHEILFVCEEKEEMARAFIADHNYTVEVVKDGGLAEHILTLQPDLVVNDILDTTVEYVEKLKAAGIKVVNFEDMGTGVEAADLVVNALYPHALSSERILVGHEYFCLRDEFLHMHHRDPGEKVERALLTFGGVDEGNLTSRVILALAEYLKNNCIALDVVLGPGYMHGNELEHTLKRCNLSDVNIVKATNKISEYAERADLAITSGGRTVLELASAQIPTIVICQNEREMTHRFASADNGIINLGHRHDVDDRTLLDSVRKVTENPQLRATMRQKAGRMNLKEGKRRVIGHIARLLEASSIQ